MTVIVQQIVSLQRHVLQVLAKIGTGTHYDIHASSPESTTLKVTQVENACRILAKKGLISFPPKANKFSDRQYSLTDKGWKELE